MAYEKRSYAGGATPTTLAGSIDTSSGTGGGSSISGGGGAVLVGVACISRPAGDRC